MRCGISLGLPTKAQSNTSVERSQQLILLHSTFAYALPGTGWRWGIRCVLSVKTYYVHVGLQEQTRFKTYQAFGQSRGIPRKPEFSTRWQRKHRDSFASSLLCLLQKICSPASAHHLVAVYGPTGVAQNWPTVKSKTSGWCHVFLSFFKTQTSK